MRKTKTSVVGQNAKEQYEVYCYTAPEVCGPPVTLEGKWAVVDFVTENMRKYYEIRVCDALDQIVVHTRKGKFVYRAP